MFFHGLFFKMKGCNKIYLKTRKIICLKNDQFRVYLYLKHFQSNDTLKNRSAYRTYVGFRKTCGVLIRNGVFYQERMLILFAVSLLGLWIGCFRLF